MLFLVWAMPMISEGEGGAERTPRERFCQHKAPPNAPSNANL